MAVISVGFNRMWRSSLWPSVLRGQEGAGSKDREKGTLSSPFGLQRGQGVGKHGQWCSSLDKHSVPCFNNQDTQGRVSVRRHCLMTPPLLTFLLKTGPPVIHSGIKDLKFLKTTQSGFEGFLKDQFTTLPEVKDRCFATQVYCKWRYHQCKDVDFEATWYEHVLGPGAGTGSVCPCLWGLKFMKSSI